MTAHQLSKRKNQVRSVRVANPKHNLTTKPKNGSCLARGIIRIIVSYILFQVLGFWLVLWNMAFIFPYLGNFIIPTDEIHHFQRGRYSTNKSLLTIINSYNNHMIYIYILINHYWQYNINHIFQRGRAQPPTRMFFVPYDGSLAQPPGCFPRGIPPAPTLLCLRLCPATWTLVAWSPNGPASKRLLLALSPAILGLFGDVLITHGQIHNLENL